MKIDNLFSRIATLVMWLLFALIWLSCNPYKQLASRPPETAKDSARLLARCIQILPLDTTGSHFIPQIDTLPDSSAYFKAILDTLAKRGVVVKDSLIVKYKDTCTSAIAIYQDGFNIGYQMGEYEGKRKAKSEVDGFYKRVMTGMDSAFQIKLRETRNGYNIRLIASDNAVGIAEKDKEKYRGKYERLVKWTWGLSVGFLLMVIICILLWKFRRQAKAANNIVNDVRNLK